MNKKSLLVLSAAALMSIGMISCGRGQGGESTPTESSSSAASHAATDVKTFTHTTMPKAFRVGEEVDLDDYMVVTYKDGTTSNSEYTASCTSDKVTLDGHKVIADEAGEYMVTCKAGSKTVRLSLDFRTQANFELIEFLGALEQNPQNYTARYYKADESTGQLSYGGISWIHNPNYVAIFNEQNPGETYTDDDGTTGQNSTILAKLSDNNAYWGEFDKTGKPVYDAGKVNFSNYYITGDLSLDGYDFTSEYTSSGEELLVGSTKVNETFLNYALSQFPDQDEDDPASYGKLYIDSLMDTDDDGKNDTALLFSTVYSGGEEYLFGYFTLSDFGTSTVQAIEDSRVDPSYIPATIDVTPIKNAFATINEGGNYTVMTSVAPCDAKGNVLVGEQYTSANTAYAAYLGTMAALISVSTVTADGLINSLYITADAGETMTSLGTTGYWNTAEDGSYAGVVSEDEDGNPVVQKQALEGVTDVFAAESVSDLTAKGVTAAKIDATDWTSKSTSGTEFTVAGNVGDTNQAGVSTNAFFAAMANTLDGFFSKGKFGDDLCACEDWSGTGAGPYQSLTIYSKYKAVTVDTDTNEISVTALVYLPFGLTNPYMLFTYSITEIGTTENDYTMFDAVEAPGTSEAPSAGE